MKARTLELSPWLPLQYSIFRVLWIASIISNIGTCMHDVGAAWLMTSLTKDPLVVSLVQTSSSLSIFLLALPAGALADIIDRRRYLIFLQAVMMCIAGALTWVTYSGIVNPQLLLFLTFCLGSTAALSAPTWQATIPELVPTKALFGAVTLSSASMNISRAIGPAIAGIIITATGPAAVFAINTLSFLVIILAFLFWHREPNESTLPAERFMGAMRTGVRYVYASPVLHNVLIRLAGFMFFASILWALLPLFARVDLGKGAATYGALFTLFGCGAVIGALLSKLMNEKCVTDQIVQIGFLLYASGIMLLAFSKNIYTANLAMLMTGFSWMIVSSTLITAAQQAIPSWIRGRGLSIYLMVQYGSLALGSIVWGALATHLTISHALFFAALGLFISCFVTKIFSLTKIKDIDHTPYLDAHAPDVKATLDVGKGPIMVNIEYLVPDDQNAQFTRIMRKMRGVRLREGVFFWKLFVDAENPNRYIECFMSETWTEHLRLHQHVSLADFRIQEKAAAFHKGKKTPRISHMIACDVSKKRKTSWKWF